MSNIHVGIGININSKMVMTPIAKSTSPRRIPPSAERACDMPVAVADGAESDACASAMIVKNIDSVRTYPSIVLF